MIKRLICAVLASILLLISGCGSIYAPSREEKPTEEAPAQTVVPAAEVEEQYYLIGMHTLLPYWREHQRGLKAAAEELGVEAVFTGVSGNEAERQIALFHRVVMKKPAGIIICPIDPEAMKAPIDAAVEQGIPVVCIDSDAPDSSRLTYIGTDNYQSGRIAGEIIGEALQGEGDVAVLTVPGIYNMEQRQKGFEDCLRERYPNIRVTAVGDDGADPVVAVDAARTILQQHPSIRGIFGTNAASGVGAAIALEEEGRQDQVVLVAYDKDAAVLDLIEQGKIRATLVQRTFAMSYYALKYLYDYNHHRPLISDGVGSNNPLPVSVNTGVIVVTSENVKDFR